jgi:hypothetical protein
MITKEKKLEFWNYLTNEKNVVRPRGITVQRLAVIKPLALESGIWFDVILRHGAESHRITPYYLDAYLREDLSFYYRVYETASYCDSGSSLYGGNNENFSEIKSSVQ